MGLPPGELQALTLHLLLALVGLLDRRNLECGRLHEETFLFLEMFAEVGLHRPLDS